MTMQHKMAQIPTFLTKFKKKINKQKGNIQRKINTTGMTLKTEDTLTS